jgi:hypothetical protein
MERRAGCAGSPIVFAADTSHRWLASANWLQKSGTGRPFQSEMGQRRHRRVHPVLQSLPSVWHWQDSELQMAADLAASLRRFSKSVATQELTEVQVSVWVCAARQMYDSALNAQKAITGRASHSICAARDCPRR